MCLPALNKKVMDQNCIQNGAFSFAPWFLMSYKANGTAGITFQGLTLPKEISNNLKHNLSAHHQSKYSWLSTLMKHSLVFFFQKRLSHRDITVWIFTLFFFLKKC